MRTFMCPPLSGVTSQKLKAPLGPSLLGRGVGGNLAGSFSPCIASSLPQFPEFLTSLADIGLVGKLAPCYSFNSCAMFACQQ